MLHIFSFNTPNPSAHTSTQRDTAYSCLCRHYVAAILALLLRILAPLFANMRLNTRRVDKRTKSLARSGLGLKRMATLKLLPHRCQTSGT